MVSEKTLASGFVQQLSLSVPAAAEDLGPLVEAGSGGGKHDDVFLLQAQPAHSRCWVEAARPRARFAPIACIFVQLSLSALSY